MDLLEPELLDGKFYDLRKNLDPFEQKDDTMLCNPLVLSRCKKMQEKHGGAP